MSRPEKGLHFAKNVKVIDWLKTEILDQVANLYKGVHHASQHVMIELGSRFASWIKP
jgi:MazG-like family